MEEFKYHILLISLIFVVISAIITEKIVDNHYKQIIWTKITVVLLSTSFFIIIIIALTD